MIGGVVGYTVVESVEGDAEAVGVVAGGVAGGGVGLVVG